MWREEAGDVEVEKIVQNGEVQKVAEAVERKKEVEEEIKDEGKDGGPIYPRG